MQDHPCALHSMQPTGKSVSNSRLDKVVIHPWRGAALGQPYHTQSGIHWDCQRPEISCLRIPLSAAESSYPGHFVKPQTHEHRTKLNFTHNSQCRCDNGKTTETKESLCQLPVAQCFARQCVSYNDKQLDGWTPAHFHFTS
jgi:hypothetical protein